MTAPTFVPQLIAESDGLFPAKIFIDDNLPERVGRGTCKLFPSRTAFGSTRTSYFFIFKIR